MNANAVGFSVNVPRMWPNSICMCSNRKSSLNSTHYLGNNCTKNEIKHLLYWMCVRARSVHIIYSSIPMNGGQNYFLILLHTFNNASLINQKWERERARIKKKNTNLTIECILHFTQLYERIKEIAEWEREREKGRKPVAGCWFNINMNIGVAFVHWDINAVRITSVPMSELYHIFLSRETTNHKMYQIIKKWFSMRPHYHQRCRNGWFSISTTATTKNPNSYRNEVRSTCFI